MFSYSKSRLCCCCCPHIIFLQAVQPKWYQDFVSDENMPDQMLFEVLTAANYMHIQPLLDLACLKVTYKIQGKDAEEVSAFFFIFYVSLVLVFEALVENPL